MTQLINEGTREFEKKQRLVEIQNAIDGSLSADLVIQSRRLIREGAMKIVEAEGKEYKDGYVFLFNDLFLITKPKRNERFQLRGEMYFKDAKVINVADTECRFFSKF